MRPGDVGNLGSSALGFLTFMLVTPVRREHGVADCLRGTVCPDVRHCYSLLGWQDAIGPLSCSRWGAAAVGLLVALSLRALGQWRRRRAVRGLVQQVITERYLRALDG